MVSEHPSFIIQHKFVEELVQRAKYTAGAEDISHEWK
jgi:hypothetical protein